MKKNFKRSAGMAVCLLGVFAASSCTKDEFFGLEDAQVMDSSTKYEIAMSQDYADYVRACYDLSKTLGQEADTLNMEVTIGDDGKRVFHKKASDIQENKALELLKKMKADYPALAKADKIDFDEIQKIAFANNDNLRDIVALIAPQSTKANNRYESLIWLNNIVDGNYLSTGHLYDDVHYVSPSYHYSTNYYTSMYVDGWNFDCHLFQWDAINSAIWYSSESVFATGGMIWGDFSAVTMSTLDFLVYWPGVTNVGTPEPEADFIVIPALSDLNQWEMDMGPCYYFNSRTHYVYDYTGDYCIIY